MKAIILLILATCLTGCITLNAVINSSNSGEVAPKKATSAGKILEVYLFYSNGEDSNLYKGQSNHGNYLLETSIASFLNDSFKFKAVNLKPTEYQKIAMPEKFKNDLVLTIFVSEKTTDLESFGEAVLRGLSFGFLKQNLQKNIEYKLELKDLKSGHIVRASLSLDTLYQYQAPMLVIPFNLDSHPFTYGQQIALHMVNLKILAHRIIQ